MLTQRDAVCRRVLGRLARALLRWRAHHELGFARLGDYARERLGLSAREVQSLARVEDRLRRLPRIAAAFEAGEVSWTHVRLLVEKATPEDEAGWVTLARGRPRAALPDRAVRRALPQNRLVTIVPRSEIADWSSTDWVARLTVRSVSCASS